MKRLMLIGCLVTTIAVPVSLATASSQSARVAAAVSHCGSFKYGTDGQQPGPSGITARQVSCWFARATALLGAAPGWSCHITVGITFSCKPRHGNGVVTFFGE